VRNELVLRRKKNAGAHLIALGAQLILCANRCGLSGGSWVEPLEKLKLDRQILLRVLAEVVDHFHAFR
jgi:hypothetical protein